MRKLKQFIKRFLKEIKTEQNKWRETDFHFGDVVQTKHGLDRGLVTKVDENNMPAKILSSPGFDLHTGDYTTICYYGGANSVGWYKTGEHMTPEKWYEIYSHKEGWERYCEDRKNQIKLDD